MSMQRLYGPVFTVPSWAKIGMVLLALVVGIIAIWQLSKTEFRLKVEEHREIQTIVATVSVMIATVLVGRSNGLELWSALVATIAVGAIAVPAIRYLVSRSPLADLEPRARLLISAISILAVGLVVPSLGSGRGALFAGTAMNVIMFLTVADAAMIFREYFEPEETATEVTDRT